MTKFEKTLDGSWVRKVKRALAQAQGQEQSHPRVDKEVEIRDMEDAVDPQSGHQQRRSELDICPLQTQILSYTRGVQFETTFSEPSYTKSFFSGPAFTESTHTKIPPLQVLPIPNHAPWMNLFTQVNFLSTCMEELVVVNDTRFYSMEDRMDQYQVGFTSQFEYLQQRIDCIEDRLEHQHEEMMAYPCFLFPFPPPRS